MWCWGYLMTVGTRQNRILSQQWMIRYNVTSILNQTPFLLSMYPESSDQAPPVLSHSGIYLKQLKFLFFVFLFPPQRHPMKNSHHLPFENWRPRKTAVDFNVKLQAWGTNIRWWQKSPSQIEKDTKCSIPRSFFHYFSFCFVLFFSILFRNPMDASIFGVGMLLCPLIRIENFIQKFLSSIPRANV